MTAGEQRGHMKHGLFSSSLFEKRFYEDVIHDLYASK